MDLKLALLLALRIGARTLRNQGDNEIADAIDRLLLARQAGMNIDAHMQRVADKLNADEPMPWPDITQRIIAETDEFLSRGPDGQLPA